LHISEHKLDKDNASQSIIAPAIKNTGTGALFGCSGALLYYRWRSPNHGWDSGGLRPNL